MYYSLRSSALIHPQGTDTFATDRTNLTVIYSAVAARHRNRFFKGVECGTNQNYIILFTEEMNYISASFYGIAWSLARVRCFANEFSRIMIVRFVRIMR